MKLIFILACGAIAYATFCRLVQMDRHSTQVRARLGFVTLAAAAAYGASSAVFWGYNPGPPGAALASAIAVVQVLASLAWRQGVPSHFRG